MMELLEVAILFLLPLGAVVYSAWLISETIGAEWFTDFELKPPFKRSVVI